MSHLEIEPFARENRILPPPGNPYEFKDLRPEVPVSQAVWNFALSEERVDEAGNRSLGRVDEAGNLDLSGLVLEQAKQQDQGKGEAYSHFTYVVDQRVLTVQETVETKLEGRQWKTLKEGNATVFSNIGRPRTGLQQVDKKVSVVDLDVKDHHGRVVARIAFDGLEDFMAFLDSHEPQEDRDSRRADASKHGYHKPHHLMTEAGNKAVPLDPLNTASLGWEEERPKTPTELDPASRQNISISLLGGSNDTWKRIIKDREQLENVPGQSLVGLTINRVQFQEPMPGKRQKVTRKLQVTGDSLLYEGTPGGAPFVRVWEVTEYDEQDRPTDQKKRFYKDAELRELFDNKAKGAWLDLTDKKRQDLAHKTVDELVDSEEWEKVRDDTFYADPHWEIPKDTLIEARRATGRIRRQIEEAGGSPPEALLASFTSDLVTEYQQAAEMLALRPSSAGNENPGQTFMHHVIHDEATLLRLLDGSPAAQVQRRQHIDYAIGLGFLKKVMPKPHLRPGEQVPVEQDGYLEVKTKPKTVYMPSPAPLEELQDFVKSDTVHTVHKIANHMNEALETAPNSTPEPDQSDVIRLGRLLRNQLAQ